MKLLVILALLQTLWTGITVAQAPVVVEREYVCGDQSYYNEDNGVIISHGGYNVSRNYGKNLHCQWKIEAPEGMYVKLSADNFTLEDTTNCDFDSLEIFDGPSSSSPSIAKYCGSILMFYTLTSTQRFMTLDFTTDDSEQLAGFKLVYTFVSEILYSCPDEHWLCNNHNCIPDAYYCDHEDDCGDDSDENSCTECTDGQFPCADGQKCIPPGWECDGDYDCDDSSDEHECPTVTPIIPTTVFSVVPGVCDKPMYRNETNGNISSPNYPNNYPLNLRCMHYVDVGPDATGIIFTFAELFKLEEDDGCDYDSITIKGDPTDLGEQIYGPYCGDTVPARVNITGSYAQVTFISDYSVAHEGFAVEFEAYP